MMIIILIFLAIGTTNRPVEFFMGLLIGVVVILPFIFMCVRSPMILELMFWVKWPLKLSVTIVRI